MLTWPSYLAGTYSRKAANRINAVYYATSAFMLTVIIIGIRDTLLVVFTTNMEYLLRLRAGGEMNFG